MTIEEARELVLDYAYGELDAEEAREFEVLMGLDEGLRFEVEALMEVRRAAAGLEHVRLPSEVRKRLLRAAKRRSASRAFLYSDILTVVERFFLSPAFTGAIVVVVALGVGINLIMETGIEDRITRLEKVEREPLAESLSPESERPPPEEGNRPTEDDETGVLPPVTIARPGPKADIPAGEPAASGDFLKSSKNITKTRSGAWRARKKTSKRPDTKAAKPAPAPVSKSAEVGPIDGMAPRGGGSGVTARRATAGARKPAGKATALTAVAQDLDYAEDEEAAATGIRLDAGLAALAEARKLGSRGREAAALEAYLGAIESGLEGRVLEDALYEAAEAAIGLGRKELARRLIGRLADLPGGKKRAEGLLDRLEDGGSK